MKKSRQVATPYHAINLHTLTGKQPMYRLLRWFTPIKNKNSIVFDKGPNITTPSYCVIFQKAYSSLISYHLISKPVTGALMAFRNIHWPT